VASALSENFHRLRGYALAVRVIVNFQHRKSWSIHTMAEDCRTTLGPHLHVASEQTLMRLFAYLGATPEALDEATGNLRRWSRGGIHIDVPEDRLHLLGVPEATNRGGGIPGEHSHEEH
jgi:hypothetical protein